MDELFTQTAPITYQTINTNYTYNDQNNQARPSEHGRPSQSARVYPDQRNQINRTISPPPQLPVDRPPVGGSNRNLNGRQLVETQDYFYFYPRRPRWYGKPAIDTSLERLQQATMLLELPLEQLLPTLENVNKILAQYDIFLMLSLTQCISVFAILFGIFWQILIPFSPAIKFSPSSLSSVLVYYLGWIVIGFTVLSLAMSSVMKFYYVNTAIPEAIDKYFKHKKRKLEQPIHSSQQSLKVKVKLEWFIERLSGEQARSNARKDEKWGIWSWMIMIVPTMKWVVKSQKVPIIN